jgi:hypothetical protein
MTTGGYAQKAGPPGSRVIVMTTGGYAQKAGPPGSRVIVMTTGGYDEPLAYGQRSTVGVTPMRRGWDAVVRPITWNQGWVRIERSGGVVRRRGGRQGL